MPKPPPAWFVSHRALIVFVGTIILPGIVLVVLGIQGARQQQRALEDLTRTSERLSNERLVREVEQQVRQLGDRCVAEIRRSDVAATLDHGDDPRTIRAVREALARVTVRHPVASGAFLIRDGALSVPLAQPPPPRSVESIAAAEPADRRPRMAALLAEAERTEIRDRDPARADRLYRSAFELARTPAVRAVSLARRARCARAGGDCEAASALMRRVVAEFPDEYNPYHQPYALALASLLSREPCAPGVAPASDADRVVALLRDVPAGRWELSGELADYYMADLRARDPGAASAGGSAPFMAQFAVGGAIAALVRRRGAPAGPEIRTDTVSALGADHQVLYARLQDGAAPDDPTVVAVVIDLAWVARSLIPSVARSLGVTPPIVVAAGAPAASATDGGVPFKELLSFWRIEPAPGTMAQTRAAVRRSTWVVAGATAIVFSLMAIGVLLLVRDARRERAVSKLKTDFVSGVTHELKTPLTVIRLYAETLSSDPHADAAERLDYYGIIMRESERLTALIDRVLDFARVDRGRKAYRLATGDLAAIVGETMASYDRYLQRRGFEVDLQLEPAPPVRCDAGAVAEALINLLDNAVKYSGESRWIGVRMAISDAGVAVEVADRGLGIAQADHGLIFDQFYRVGQKTGKGGYGLGLFLVKHIMDAHGGEVQVESEPGRGSRFRLVFPAVPAAGTEPARGMASRAPGAVHP